jgi:hypothetical protein
MRPEITSRPLERTTRSGLLEKEPQDGRPGCKLSLARSECIVGTPASRGNSERKQESKEENNEEKREVAM